MLPNFIHAGVPKSGSATINSIAKAHPDIFVSRQKEPNFFNMNQRFERGLDWYRTTYFDQVGNARVIGDMSINYSTGLSFDVPERIASTLGDDLHILLTMREPVARAHSQYCMAAFKGQFERLGFSEAIERALAAAPYVTAADRLRVRTGTYYSNRRDMDIFRYCMYIEPGNYADIYATWSATFGSKRILVLLTENMAQNLQAQADLLFAFLGLSSIPIMPNLRRNEATSLRYPILRRCLNSLYAIGPVRRAIYDPSTLKFRKWARKQLLSWNYTPNTSIPKPDQQAVKRLRTYYEPQVDRLEALLGRSLNEWRKVENKVSLVTGE